MNKFLRLPDTHVGHPHFVRDAKRHLERAFTALSVLFFVVIGNIVFVTVSQAAPAIAQVGVGWFFNDGTKGILLQPIGNDSPVAAAAIPDAIGFERQLLALLNRARADRGMPPLRLNDALTRAARGNAREMAATKKFDVLDGKGRDPHARAEAAGYSQHAVQVEVISSGSQRPEFVMQQVLANSNAAANLFNPDVNEVGLGYAFAKGDALAHYWTIDFGRQSATSFTVVANNGAESTTNPRVTLNIGGKGWAQQMQIASTPDYAGAPWEPYAETKAWILREGTGPKKVFVKLRGAGFQEVEAVAEIGLVPAIKGQAPSQHASVAQRAPRAPNVRSLTLAGEVGSGAGSTTTLQIAAAPDALKPNFYQTSEFMLGKVAVGIVMPQCTGAIDRCTETWNAGAMDQVVAQVQSALTWWAARLGGRVSFVYDIRRQTPTGYEPINRPQSDESLWIGDTLAQMGFPGVNYFEQVYAYNNYLRQQNSADWAMTVFVANSLNSSSGTFSNGYFAYAYVPGPFMVVTYDNDGYGITKMNAVVAHEAGHVFGALDQYQGANVVCAQTSGYLAAPNQNSEAGGCSSNAPSIMRGGSAPFTNNSIDPYALAQIGGRASANPAIPDPINTTPRVTLNAVASTISNLPLTIAGNAEDQAYAPPTGDTININTIANVQYRINDGGWQNATPAGNSQFNLVSQNFSFAPALVAGQNVIEVMATNRVGNTGTASVTVNYTGAATAPTTQPAAPTATHAPPTNTTLAPTATIILPTATGAPATTRIIPTTTALPPTATNIPPTATRVAPTTTPIAPPPPSAGFIVIAINPGNTALALPSSDYKASSLIDAINAQGGSVYEINKWTGRVWEPYVAAGSGADFAIQAGVGYMLKAKNASAFRVKPDPMRAFKQVQVKKGWDFIGVPICKDGTQSCITASSLAAAINAQGGGVAEIDRWVNGAWNSYLIGYSQNDFPIISGQGYYIRSTKATVWKPE